MAKAQNELKLARDKGEQENIQILQKQDDNQGPDRPILKVNEGDKDTSAKWKQQQYCFSVFTKRLVNIKHLTVNTGENDREPAAKGGKEVMS